MITTISGSELLEQRDVFNKHCHTPLILSEFHDLLRGVSYYNGYFAGGFVRDYYCLANKMYNENKQFEIVNRILPLYRKPNQFDPDIDVFFYDKDSYDRFIADNTHLHCSNSYANNAVECFLPRSQKRVQFINCIFGKPEVVLDSFDLLPSRIAIDNHNTYLDENWLQFEQQRILHVIRWDQPIVFKRLEKYIHRGYTDLSVDTKKTLVKMAKNYYELVKANKIADLNLRQYAHAILSVVCKVQDNLTAQDLLDLTVLDIQTTSASYGSINDFRNQIMSILLQRVVK